MLYRHIPQKPYCCVPACIQMILRRRKKQFPSQEDIAFGLGVVLPPEDRHLLPRSYKERRPKAGWGTRINIKKYSITEFFRKQQISLKETFYPATNFRLLGEFRKFLLTNIKTGNDLLVCFNYPLLYKMEGSWGHASLIADVRGRYVTLSDPSPKHSMPRKVLLSDLLVSLQDHYCGGIWLIEKSKKSREVRI